MRVNQQEFAGKNDKAFSWEKVAPKGPDVGR